MATIITPYGYDVLVDDDISVLPSLVTPEQLVIASNNRLSSDDPRLETACRTISSAIRDFCGWHIAPNLRCILSTEVDTKVIMLPAKLVTSVETISCGNESISDYEWKRSGALRFSHLPLRRGRWGAYEISYNAGYDTDTLPLSQIAIQIALNNLMATPGVRNESVGQVALTYNQMTDNVSGGVQLLDRDKDLLRQYRLHTLSR